MTHRVKVTALERKTEPSQLASSVRPSFLRQMPERCPAPSVHFRWHLAHTDTAAVARAHSNSLSSGRRLLHVLAKILLPFDLLLLLLASLLLNDRARSIRTLRTPSASHRPQRQTHQTRAARQAQCLQKWLLAQQKNARSNPLFSLHSIGLAVHCPCLLTLRPPRALLHSWLVCDMRKTIAKQHPHATRSILMQSSTDTDRLAPRSNISRCHSTRRCRQRDLTTRTTPE